jgi:hypothetical protein
MNKKGGLVGTIFDVIIILILVLSLYIIWRNFSGSCIINNLIHMTNWSMHNCIKP